MLVKNGSSLNSPSVYIGFHPFQWRFSGAALSSALLSEGGIGVVRVCIIAFSDETVGITSVIFSIIRNQSTSFLCRKRLRKIHTGRWMPRLCAPRFSLKVFDCRHLQVKLKISSNLKDYQAWAFPPPRLLKLYLELRKDSTHLEFLRSLAQSAALLLRPNQHRDLPSTPDRRPAPQRMKVGSHNCLTSQPSKIL